MENRPTYEDAIGAQLLTDVLSFSSNIKERHDTLEFLNHIYIRHTVRLVVDLDGPAQPATRAATEFAPFRVWGQGSLENHRGQVLVPLGFLDRHSRATTHVSDESGSVVPLVTAGEINRRLGSGLVCYAAKILAGSGSLELIEHLRQIPVGAESRQLEIAADITPQEAADDAFDGACEELLKFRPEGPLLLRNLAFRHALAVVTSATQLLVEMDPAPGRLRAFTYSYVRPIAPDNSHTAKPSALGPEGRVRRLLGRVRSNVRRRWRTLTRYVNRSGVAALNIDLGPLGSCERYHLSAEAPFDTWFARATLRRHDGASRTSEPIDTSQRFRLDYRQISASSPWSGTLQIELRTVLTGVARAGYYAGIFLAVCAVAGLVRVILAPDHVLLDSEAEAAASLLLLFPGVAASAVAGSVRNTLTATLQFPTRLTLWGLSVLSFALAVSGAFRVGGTLNTCIWSFCTFFACFAAIVLVRRARSWGQRP